MWLKMSWRDFRLTWEESRYENTNLIRVSPSMIWKPDVALYNKQDLANGILAADPKSSNTNAQLFSNGNIVWIVPVSHKVTLPITWDEEIKRIFRSCVRGSPTATGPGACRCVISVLAPGPMTPPTMFCISTMILSRWISDSLASTTSLQFSNKMPSKRLPSKYNSQLHVQVCFLHFLLRYDCCPNPLVKLKFHFTLKREFVVDPNLGRINNPDEHFP